MGDVVYTIAGVYVSLLENTNERVYRKLYANVVMEPVIPLPIVIE